MNKALFDYERNELNNTTSMNNSILARGGNPLNTCVLFQSYSLRAIGIKVPQNVTFTTNLAQYLEANNWSKETNFSNLQSGDLCFAGNTHTFVFMGWKNKSKNLAYVMGDESYMFPTNYRVRNLNGIVGNSSNGNNGQYQTTFYLKYTANQQPTSQIESQKTQSILKNTLGRVAVNSSSGLWLTSEMNYSSKKLVCLDNNLILYVLSSQKGWYEVYYEGQIGWITAQYTTKLGNPIANNSANIENTNSLKNL
ncbi:MAG: hypothetical protein ACRC6T_12685 [Sarcina sp.]